MALDEDALNMICMPPSAPEPLSMEPSFVLVSKAPEGSHEEFQPRPATSPAMFGRPAALVVPAVPLPWMNLSVRFGRLINFICSTARQYLTFILSFQQFLSC